MNYLTETAYRFCTRGEQYYSLYQQNKAAYIWLAENWQDDCDEESIGKGTFTAILRYMQDMKAAPKSLDAMQQFVTHNPKLVQEFQRTELLDEEIRALQEHEPESTWDDAVLFEGLMTKARAAWSDTIFGNARSISSGAVKDPYTKETGTNAAIHYVRTALTKDFRPEAPAMAGILHENIPAILTNLDALGTEQATTGRFKLGLPHIDQNVVVGRQNLMFLGILGMSGDGKTTLTNFIVYNWLRQGAHILYCSTEHSPEQIWNYMAFLHQSHPDYQSHFTIPAITEWRQGKATPEDRHNMNKILVDIQDRKNLPGLLDCQTFRDWESIKDYLAVNHKKNKYDILVVDYLGRLNVPGDQRFRAQAVAAMVHDAQGLSRTFDANRGIIILSPMQVNREGNKKAKNTEEGGARYDLNAISQVSEYQHDLDLCLSVYSDDDMRMENKIEIQQLKEREGKRSRPEVMNLNTDSGAFEYEIPGMPKGEMHKQWERTADDVIDATTLDISHNADEWGA